MILVADLDFTLTRVSTLLEFFRVLDSEFPGIAGKVSDIVSMRTAGRKGYMETLNSLLSLLSSAMSGMDAGHVRDLAEGMFSPSHFRGFVDSLKGEDIIIVTATPYPISRPYAEYLGARLLAPEMDERNGVLTGRIGHEAFLENGKREMMAAAGIARADIGMGDSVQDIPLLEISDFPVAVFPQPDMERIARMEGIPVAKSDETVEKIIDAVRNSARHSGR